MPSSLIPFTIVSPTPLGSSTEVNVAAEMLYTKPWVALLLSVQKPTTWPLLFKPLADVPAPIVGLARVGGAASGGSGAGSRR